jgi:predicted nucleic acid-binding Zn finger protein
MKLLSDRYERAMSLIEEKAVKKYIFTPSSRIIWIVKGKKKTYQVIPQSNFCSCDDFYFRVLDKKKQMCYHLVAQGLAYALNRYEILELSDHEYEKISSRFRPKPFT